MQTIYLACGKWWGVLKITFIQGRVYLAISMRGVVKIIQVWGWRFCEALIRVHRAVIRCIDVLKQLEGSLRASPWLWSRLCWCCPAGGAEEMRAHAHDVTSLLLYTELEAGSFSMIPGPEASYRTLTSVLITSPGNTTNHTDALSKRYVMTIF